MKTLLLLACAAILSMNAYALEPTKTRVIESGALNHFLVTEWCSEDGYKMITTSDSFGSQTIQVYGRNKNSSGGAQPIKCKGKR